MKDDIMRKLLVLLIAFGVILAGCSDKGGAEGGPGKKKIIKLSHSHRDTFSDELHTSSWIFQKYVNDFSSTLEVKIYPSNALGQERKVYEGIQLGGGADCIISGTAILNNFHERIGVLDLPFLWEDYGRVHRVLDGEVGEILAEELKGKGFHVLAKMESFG